MAAGKREFTKLRVSNTQHPATSNKQPVTRNIFSSIAIHNSKHHSSFQTSFINHNSSLRRLVTLLSIIIIVPLGLATKYYQGSGCAWIPNQLGGLFYVVFWCLLAFLIFPQASGWKIVGVVLLITVILEFLQLVHPAFLEVIRDTYIGKALIGTSFNPIDFIFYFLGAGIGLLWIYGLKRIKNR